MIYVGVGGWTFEPWRGEFYPEGLPHKRELEYAASKLTSIEVNGTFYRGQTAKTFADWAAAAPEGFVFSLKAPRFAVSRKVLGEGGESVARFFTTGIEALGDKLGPILWQFAPTKAFDRDDIARFLDLLPEAHDGRRLRHVLEPRHDSFNDPAFIDLMTARGAAIAWADADDYPAIGDPAAPTADFVYARLQRTEARHATGYAAGRLDHWAAEAKRWAAGGRDVFVYVISGAKVRNPAAAMALIERLK